MSNATVGSLKVVLGLDSAAFTQGLSAAQKHLRGVGQQMQRVGQTMATVGAGMTAAITAPVIALGIHFGKAAIAAEEMQSAFKVSFGAMAADVQSWATVTGDAMGRSTFELQEMALGFNGLFKAGGPVSALATDMARQFTVLAQDLSSFHNIAQQDVFDALRSGLSGEAEPLRKFNVYLTEGAVKAEAYALGLAKAGAELTEQQKIQARASLIMKGTAEAQGDVIRTASGTQNTLRALQSQWAELSVTLGQKILPVLTPIVTKLNEVALSFSKLSPGMQQFILIAAGVAAVLGPALVAIGAVVSAIGAIAPLLAPVIAAFGVIAAGITAPVWIALAAAVGVAAVAFAVFGKNVMPLLTKFGKLISEVFGPIVSDAIKMIGPEFTKLGNLISDIMGSRFIKSLQALQMAFASVFGEALIRGLGVFVRALIGGFQLIGDALSILGDLLTGDFSGAWEGMKRMAAHAADTLRGIFRALGPQVTEFVKKMVLGVADWLVTRFRSTVVEPVVRMIGTVKDTFFKLYDAVVGHSYIPDMVEGIAAWMAKLDAGMVVPARNATDATRQTFETLRDDVAAIFESLLTDNERSMREIERQVATINRAVADPRLGVSREQGDRMITAVRAGYQEAIDPSPERRDRAELAVPVWLKHFQDHQAEVKQAFDDRAREFGDAFSSAMTGVLNGDIKGVLMGLLNDFLSGMLRSLGENLFKSSGGDPFGGIMSSLFGGFKLPGFKTGGSFRVGGSGGLDSQTVAFRATPGEMVDIKKPGQMDGGAMALTVNPSPYFDVVVEKVASRPAARAGMQAVGASRSIIPGELARASRFRLGRG